MNCYYFEGLQCLTESNQRTLLTARRFYHSPKALIALCVLCVAAMWTGSWNWASVSYKFYHYPWSLCTKNSTQVVVAIRSWPGRGHSRAAIRLSIAHSSVRSALPDWAFLFYTGFLKDSKSIDALRREISKYGDLLVAPHESTANNSVEIALDMMRWVERRCGKGHPLRLFVHVNESVFVDPVALEGYSNEMNKNARPSFYCKVVEGVDVGRNPQGVNFVPRNLFRGPVFPPYCEGGAFFINGTHLGQLYAASLYALHYALVPQYMTGHMAVIANMVHVNVSERIDAVGSLQDDTKWRKRASLRPNIFLTGVQKNMWKDVWRYSLYNQTRDSKLEKDLIDGIIGRLGSS